MRVQWRHILCEDFVEHLGCAKLRLGSRRTWLPSVSAPRPPALHAAKSTKTQHQINLTEARRSQSRRWWRRRVSFTAAACAGQAWGGLGAAGLQRSGGKSKRWWQSSTLERNGGKRRHGRSWIFLAVSFSCVSRAIARAPADTQYMAHRI
jgi:hypothetical protein